MVDAAHRQDDSSIADSCRLYRRINPEQVIWDQNRGAYRISSGAFTHSELSVHNGDEMMSIGIDPVAVVASLPAWDLVAITAATARANTQSVVRDPRHDSICHGLVYGRKSDRVKKAFVAEAMNNWIVQRNQAGPPVRLVIRAGPPTER